MTYPALGLCMVIIFFGRDHASLLKMRVLQQQEPSTPQPAHRGVQITAVNVILMRVEVVHHSRHGLPQ